MVIDLAPPASASSRRSVIAWRRCPSLVEADSSSVTSAMWGSRPTGLPKRSSRAGARKPWLWSTARVRAAGSESRSW